MQKLKITLLICTLILIAGCQSTEPATKVEKPVPQVIKETTKKTYQNDKLTYSNKDYGFELKLPKEWEGYLVSKREFELSIGLVPSLDFGFEEQDSVFNISMYSLEQWSKIESEGGPIPAEIGKNNKFVFAYSPAQSANNSELEARLQEVQEIINTFNAQTL